MPLGQEHSTLTWAPLAQVKEVHCHACSQKLTGSGHSRYACPCDARREEGWTYACKAFAEQDIQCLQTLVVPIIAITACSCDDETQRLVIAATGLDCCAAKLLTT